MALFVEAAPHMCEAGVCNAFANFFTSLTSRFLLLKQTHQHKTTSMAVKWWEFKICGVFHQSTHLNQKTRYIENKRYQKIFFLKHGCYSKINSIWIQGCFYGLMHFLVRLCCARSLLTLLAPIPRHTSTHQCSQTCLEAYRPTQKCSAVVSQNCQSASGHYVE